MSRRPKVEIGKHHADFCRILLEIAMGGRKNGEVKTEDWEGTFLVFNPRDVQKLENIDAGLGCLVHPDIRADVIVTISYQNGTSGTYGLSNRAMGEYQSQKN